MASSLPSFLGITKTSLKHKARRSLEVRAQSFRDEGMSMNIVDANLSVLRERIEEVRVKERLKRCCRIENGWNYPSGYDHKLRRDAELSESLELAWLVGGAVGVTFLSGTLILCLVSLVIHLCQ